MAGFLPAIGVGLGAGLLSYLSPQYRNVLPSKPSGGGPVKGPIVRHLPKPGPPPESWTKKPVLDSSATAIKANATKLMSDVGNTIYNGRLSYSRW